MSNAASQAEIDAAMAYENLFVKGLFEEWTPRRYSLVIEYLTWHAELGSLPARLSCGLGQPAPW